MDLFDQIAETVYGLMQTSTKILHAANALPKSPKGGGTKPPSSSHTLDLRSKRCSQWNIEVSMCISASLGTAQ